MDGLIDKLRIRLRSPRQTLVRLSGGNQQKVAIAKWLPLAPEIYLLAEPTRGIDVGTKQEIYRLMRELTAAGASILLISSDTIELLGLCDRVLVMYERQPVAMLVGDEVTEENVVHASVAGHQNDRTVTNPTQSAATLAERPIWTVMLRRFLELVVHRLRSPARQTRSLGSPSRWSAARLAGCRADLWRDAHLRAHLLLSDA